MNTHQKDTSPSISTPPSGGSAGGFWSSQYYDSLFQLERRWAKLMIEERRPFVIYGGRGVGKSPTMKWIRDELIIKREKYEAFAFPTEDDEDGSAADCATYLCIAGKTAGKAERNPSETLRDAARADPPPTALMIDDVDQILEHAKRAPNGASGVSEEIKELLENLRRFIPVDGEKRQLILSATEEVHEPRFDDPEVRREEELWSGLFARIERRQLNPWSSFAWQEELRELIHEMLSPTASAAGSALPEAAQTNLAKVVPDIIVALSGGHPKLTVQLLDGLEDFWRKAENLREPLEVRIVELCTRQGGHEPELESLLRRYLEDRLVRSPRGLRSLRRSIQRLRTRHDERAKRCSAFSELLRIAGTENRGASAPDDFDIRLQLTAGGLVYEDPASLRFVVPGEVLRGEVMRHRVESPQPTRAKQPLSLAPSPKNPDEEGVLAASRSDGERIQVPLDGRNWKILAALDKSRGQVVSIDDLATELQAQAAATRSALRRLREKLEDYGLDEILDNQWGKGYRLVEPS